MTTPITIHELINKRVFFLLVSERLPRDLIGQATGIYNPNGWIKAKLLGSDEIGIWFENPNFTVKYISDDKGNPIPPSEQKKTHEPSAVLIKWQFIASIVCMDESEPKRPTMGFTSLGAKTENT